MNDADPNTDVLDVIRRRWDTSHEKGAHDYTDEGCRILAERAFKDIRILFAALDRLVNDLRDAQSITYSGLVTRTLQRAESAEAALRDAQTERDRWRAVACNVKDGTQAAESERDRLREALATIVRDYDDSGEVQIARAALRENT